MSFLSAVPLPRSLVLQQALAETAEHNPETQPAGGWLKRLLALLTVAVLAVIVTPLRAADAPDIRVSLNADNAGPHEMQDTTRTSITNSYARAWESMANALSANRADVLDKAFLGTARDNLAQRIADQKANGMTTRVIDRGHKVDVLFYSPDGLSMQLRDTAQVEMQVLDGDKVVHSETGTRHYIVLMTPTEVTWKVRILQETE